MLPDVITWTADPAIFSIFGREIRWYGLFFAVGFLIGYAIEDRIYKHDNAPAGWCDKVFIYTIVATIIGARLGHCIFYGWEYYSAHPIDIFKIWEGGLASHGGTIGIIIALYIFSRRVTHRNLLWALDRLAIPTSFVALPWGFRFIENVGAWHTYGMEPVFSAPSHPTQIYEALCYLLVFAVLMYMYWKRRAGDRPGLILGIFFIGIFLSRFFIEFVKNDQEAFEADMVLNMGQWLSIPFVIAGVWLIVRALRLPEVPGAIDPKATAKMKKQ